MSYSINFRVSKDLPSKTKKRMNYTFGVFCAWYGYKKEDNGKANLVVGYGSSSILDNADIYIPCIYKERDLNKPAPSPIIYKYFSYYLPLFHSKEFNNIDYLAEIFEWISLSHEYSIDKKDNVGRPDIKYSLFNKYKLNSNIPYASIFAHMLNKKLISTKKVKGSVYIDKSKNHYLVCTHDIDFYYTNFKSLLHRIIKNIILSIIITKDHRFFISSFFLLIKSFFAKPIGLYLPILSKKLFEMGISSTFFVIPKNKHFRDSNYKLVEILESIYVAQKNGFRLGLHGSYKSIIELNDLHDENKFLSDISKSIIRGGRQHWLRFDKLKKLFVNIVKSKLEYDSTLGFSDRTGFRTGSACSFPPYNFDKEEAYPFLEIPLILMDSALGSITKKKNKLSYINETNEVLKNYRLWSHGGVSILWHNPIEPLGGSSDLNSVFWELASKRIKNNEKWISAEEYLDLVKTRFIQAGFNLNS